MIVSMILMMMIMMIVMYTFARLDYDDFMFMSSSIIYCIIESVASSISLKASGNISGEKKWVRSMITMHWSIRKIMMLMMMMIIIIIIIMIRVTTYYLLAIIYSKASQFGA